MKASRLILLFVMVTMPQWILSAAEVEAQLDWAEHSRIGTTVSGKITKLHVRPGDRVKKNALLVELDGRYFQARQNQNRALVKYRQLLLEEAQREQDRANELYERTVLSDHELQLAQIGLAKAQSELAEAQSRLRQASLDYEYSRIRAPYDSIVLQVLTSSGEVVVNNTETQPLVEIARADKMIVRALLPQKTVMALKPGQGIEVAVRGQWRQAKIRFTGWQPATGSGRTAVYEVAAEFDLKPDEILKAGEMSAMRFADGE